VQSRAQRENHHPENREKIAIHSTDIKPPPRTDRKLPSITEKETSIQRESHQGERKINCITYPALEEKEKCVLCGY